MIATHDPTMLTEAAQSAQKHGRTRGRLGGANAFGVRTDLQRQAVQDGRQMRIYVPYGTDRYGYSCAGWPNVRRTLPSSSAHSLTADPPDQL